MHEGELQRAATEFRTGLAELQLHLVGHAFRADSRPRRLVRACALWCRRSNAKTTMVSSATSQVTSVPRSMICGVATSNITINPTTQKRRFWVPSSLRSSAAGYLQRLGCINVKTLLLLLVAATIPACAAAPSRESPVKVFNLSQGLARQDPGGNWEIYRKGNNFVYENNGKCIAKGESKPCMWHAVAFEYSAAEEVTTLECTATFSSPTDVVDPEALRAANTKNHTFSSVLHGRSGKVFWQGYIIRDERPLSRHTTVACRSNGKTVVSYSYSVTEQPNKPLEGTR